LFARDKWGDTALIDCGYKGNTDAFHALVGAARLGGLDLLALASNHKTGLSALHAAAVNGHDDTAAAIIRSGVVPYDARTKSGSTAAQLACAKGYVAVAQAVSNGDKNVFVNELSGNTALMDAASEARADVVAYLLREKLCDPAARNNAGWTAAMCAAASNATRDNSGVIAQLVAASSIETLADPGTGLTALHLAVNVNSVGTVRALVAQYFGGRYERRGLSIDRATKGWSPLLLACTTANDEVARMLFSAGARAMVNHVTGQTALMVAAGAGSVTMVRWVLAMTPVDRAALLVPDFDGYNAVLRAAQSHNPEVLEIVLKRAAGVEGRRGGVASSRLHPASLVNPVNKMTILHVASQMGHMRVLRQIRRSVPRLDVNAMDKDGETPLHYATATGNVEVVRWLLRALHADIEARSPTSGVTPLMWAAEQQHTELVELFLVQGAKPKVCDMLGRTAMDRAMISRHQLVVRVLRLADMRDPESALAQAGKTIPALHAAAETNDIQTVQRALLSFSDTVDPLGWHALHVAAARGHLDIVRLLVESNPEGVDVRGTDLECSPLLLAVHEGHLEVAQFLVEHGADPLAVSRKRENAVLLAAGLSALHGNERTERAFKIVTWLVSELDVDPTAADKFGNTALHAAAGADNDLIVDWLVEERGMNPDTRNEDGQRPLHVAVLGSCHGSTSALVKHGANVMKRDRRGQAPWEMAQQMFDSLHRTLKKLQ
jgi:ankyrin repeat protein